MTKLLFFLLLILPSALLQAQNRKILDSLTQLYQTAKHDTSKILLLNDIAFEYRRTKPDTCLSLATQALERSEKIGFEKGKALAMTRIGTGNLHKNNYTLALEYYQKSLKISETVLKDKELIGSNLNSIGEFYRSQGNYPLALEYYQRNLKIVETLGNKRFIAATCNNIGLVYQNQGNYPLALEYHQKSLKIKEEIGDKQSISSSFNNIGLIYYYQHNYPLALEYHQKSLKIKEEIGDKQGISSSLNNIGIVYQSQSNYTLALEYYQKSLKIKEAIGDKQGISASLTNIGDIYCKQNQCALALEYAQKGLKIREEIGDKKGVGSSLTNIGQIYQQLQDYDKSIEYALKSLQIAQSIHTFKEAAEASYTVYNSYKLKGDYVKALNYYELNRAILDTLFNLEKAKSIANLESKMALEKKEKEFVLLAKDNELNKLSAEKQAHELEITKKQAQADQLFALARAEKDKHKQDSLYNLAQKSQLEAKNLKIQEEKNRLEQEKKALAYEAEVTSQKQIRNTFFIFSFALIFIVALVVFNLRQKQKSNKLLAAQKLEIEDKNKNLQDANQEIQTANEELYQTQEEILAQRDLLGNKNRLLEQYTHKIGKSIEAAQMIQKAILPPKDKMATLFQEHFVLFMPKDIVSGDFWWANEVDGEKYLIVADCTGHGVSGAMLTMIGASLLDRIIRLMGIREPAEILTKLHEEVKAVLQQDQTKNNEGMDIAITHWHYENENCILSFAAAKRPLIYALEGKIEKVGGSRRNIGGVVDSAKYFENKIFILPKGTSLYLCSDGYGDQNDFARIKFSEKRLMDLLQENQNLEMQAQKEILKAQILTHMEGTEQRDDILVIGVKV